MQSWQTIPHGYQNGRPNRFFKKIKDVYVFNINDFVSYIQDKNFLNDSYTKYKNKIGLSEGDKFLKERREITLSFPFKDCILEGGQTKEEDKRKEIVFNEILAHDEIDRLLEPKVLTNFKRYTANGEEKLNDLKRDEKGIISENVIVCVLVPIYLFLSGAEKGMWRRGHGGVK